MVKVKGFKEHEKSFLFFWVLVIVYYVSDEYIGYAVLAYVFFILFLIDFIYYCYKYFKTREFKNKNKGKDGVV